MSSGKRALNSDKAPKINIIKIIAVITIIIVTIIAIIIFIKSVLNNGTQEEIIEEIATNEVSSSEDIISEKTLEDVVTEFGGTLKEKIKPDTAYCTKDGKEYTIYKDGEVVEGRVVLWDGTSQKPAIDEAGNINIYNPAELRWVAEQVESGEKSFAGVTINLRNSLDFGARKNENGNWEGTTWTPIIGFLKNVEDPTENQDVTQEYLKRFAGVFIGNGCTIRGIYINTISKYAGLFGYQTGTITGLNLKNSYIKGSEGVGALVGLNGGSIQNINIENVEVVGTEKIGGLIGIATTSSNIEDCNTNAIVSGEKYIGGLVGYVNNNANITRVQNKSSLQGKQYVGGIAGISFYATIIKDATNYSEKILAEEYIGGIVGYSQSQIENSSNKSKGILSGDNYVGGIVGANYQMGNITNCFNTSKVISKQDNLGGITGINNGSISNCYNSGEIYSAEAERNKNWRNLRSKSF